VSVKRTTVVKLSGKDDAARAELERVLEEQEQFASWVKSVRVRLVKLNRSP
jgi:hypothetical protein